MVPQRGVSSAPGARDTLNVFDLCEIIGQFRTLAGVVVVVFIVVNPPIVMEAGVDDDPVVLSDLQPILGTSSVEFFRGDDVPDTGAHLGGIAARSLEFGLKLVTQIAHIHNNAGANAAIQRNLTEEIAVFLAVHLLLMENMDRGVHMSASVKGARVGIGPLMEAAQILPPGENQILPGTGEGP